MSELPESKATRTWQKRLLPLVVIMIAGLTIFFVVATYLQLDQLGEQIQQSPKLDLSPALNAKLTDENSFQALALLGTILMITAMVTNPAIKVNEGRSFVGTKDTPVPGVEQ